MHISQFRSGNVVSLAVEPAHIRLQLLHDMRVPDQQETGRQK